MIIPAAVARRVARSCLRRVYSSKVSGMENIYRKIQAAGPITVAEYMKECLLNPVTGYYMQPKRIGADRDFITSPEISQVFGELLGVWVVAGWMNADQPSPCHVVELGPGNGTLLCDMFRVFRQLNHIVPALSVHLVEASPALAMIQADSINCSIYGGAAGPSSQLFYQSGVAHGVNIYWYRHLQHVPRGHAYYIAHEFFDALPVHQFKRTPAGWREVLVATDNTKSDKALMYALAPGPTPASAAYSTLLSGEEKELCPDGLLLAKELAGRVRDYGGAALLGDYGQETITELTFRAFRDHKQCHPLTTPGEVDITADVDFGALKQAAQQEGAVVSGPVTQNEFLHTLGIRQRINALIQATPPPSREVVDRLIASYEFLCSPDSMGERFKFLTLNAAPPPAATV